MLLVLTAVAIICLAAAIADTRVSMNGFRSEYSVHSFNISVRIMTSLCVKQTEITEYSPECGECIG